MCRLSALAGYCVGVRHCAGHMATAQSALPAAIKRDCVAIAARALQEVADGALGNAILEVSVHTTEGELLALLVVCLLECIVGKQTIVTVVMLIFLCHAQWQRAQRRVWRQRFWLMSHRLGGGQSVGGCSGQRRQLHTCTAFW